MFPNNDIKKIILLSRKGVYPHEYMDDGGKFDEKSLPKKDEFLSNLNMENITDAHIISMEKEYIKTLKKKN